MAGALLGSLLVLWLAGVVVVPAALYLAVSRADFRLAGLLVLYYAWRLAFPTKEWAFVRRIYCNGAKYFDLQEVVFDGTCIIVRIEEVVLIKQSPYDLSLHVVFLLYAHHRFRGDRAELQVSHCIPSAWNTHDRVSSIAHYALRLGACYPGKGNLHSSFNVSMDKTTAGL